MTIFIARSDRAELVARAVALQPLLREHAGQMDAERHLADEVNAALVDAGDVPAPDPEAPRRL